ncbi:MAG: SHOCT domain-containing protein [Burkholderiales bacterium]
MYMKPLFYAIFLTATFLGGCGTAKPKGPRVDVTIGQQLIELKEAHAAGALNDAEYARQRKALIDNMQ